MPCCVIWGWTGILRLFMAATACPSENPTRHHCLRRQAIWAEREPAAYAFEVLRSCFCGPPLTDTVTVKVNKAVTLRNIPLLPALLPDIITETVTMRCGGWAKHPVTTAA